MNKVYKSTRLFKRSFLIIRNSAFNLILTFNIVFCIKAGRGLGVYRIKNTITGYTVSFFVIIGAAEQYNQISIYSEVKL